MLATYIQDGDVLDHIPTTDLPAGAVVVLGVLIGVTPRPIPAGTLGSLAVTGVWEVPVAPGVAGTTGTPVYWDPTSNRATLTTTLSPQQVRCGVLAQPLAASDLTLRVLINVPGPA